MDNILPYPFNWSEEQQAYLYGNGINGIGVYFDKGEWRGNFVLDCEPSLFHGPFDSLEIAKTEMTKAYIKAQQEPK